MDASSAVTLLGGLGLFLLGIHHLTEGVKDLAGDSLRRAPKGSSPGVSAPLLRRGFHSPRPRQSSPSSASSARDCSRSRMRSGSLWVRHSERPRRQGWWRSSNFVRGSLPRPCPSSALAPFCGRRRPRGATHGAGAYPSQHDRWRPRNGVSRTARGSGRLGGSRLDDPDSVLALAAFSSIFKFADVVAFYPWMDRFSQFIVRISGRGSESAIRR